MIKLNLGSGNDYLKDHINIDQSERVFCDKVMDFEKDPIPFDDQSVDGITAKMIVEHIFNIDHFMNECWRVLKPGCEMLVTTPTAGTVAYWKDPTHVKGFVEQTFKYYAEWNTDKAYGRKTWNIKSIHTHLKGDENEYIECILIKP